MEMKRVGQRLCLFTRFGIQPFEIQAFCDSFVELGLGGRSEITWSKLMRILHAVPCRGCSYEAAEQEVLPHGVLDSSQEQHEGDPFLCQLHVPAVPVLLPPAPAPA